MASDSNPVQLDATLIAELTKRIVALENRVQTLEEDKTRFLGALKGAAEMCLENPLVVSMMPKKMKEDLRAYLA